MKFLITNTEISKETSEKLPFNLFSKETGPFNILIENRDKIIETGSHYSITDGYLRDLNLKSGKVEDHVFSALESMITQWPLPEHITGSFSTTIIDIKSLEITLCNDLIGLYPVYY